MGERVTAFPQRAGCPQGVNLADQHMPPHQVRVVEEKRDLLVKVEALGRFLGTPIFASLPYEEQSRLRRQLGVMQQYADILEERVRNF